ncbi:fumarate reductase flavo protein subunit [Delitschia confertaspora ATCC 74209]|uniref:Fumarate reductase flavo protein subunit n=1 Tax=Delitschia confertaspora ATCC 74209 TaxID=1513339 RepID=A0A9P4JTQ8_9PLEO|nr:fumarate reductase flavo protein subunit [Delitschia confertaspora ATCC 74209]
MASIPSESCSILVIGSGNAGFSAAISASQSGCKDILLIDKCPSSWIGGNTYFTAGAFRTVHNGLSDLLPIVNNVDEETAQIIDVEAYTVGDFMEDLKRVTGGRCDKELGRVLVEKSNETVKWLAGLGVRFQLAFNRQAYKVEGRFKFWGGLHLKTQDGGKGLVQDYLAAAKNHGIRTLFSTAATQIHIDTETGAVTSVRVEQNGKPKLIHTRAVILAAGGFEASPSLRAQYLGPSWELAYVRGTPYNTGDLLTIAIHSVSAKTAGNWSGCHSVAWDANASPNSGDRGVSNEFTKSGYPLGIMVNANGERFVDEGVDLRNYTYAKFGKKILEQEGGVAWQVWDGKMIPYLRKEEYRDEIVERIMAESLGELAEKCGETGLVEKERFVQTMEKYNEAVYAHRKEHPNMKWDPAVKDSLSTQSSTLRLPLPKSNWALPIDEPPFLAVKVACGITFTFGGLQIDPETAGVVKSTTDSVVPGLFCCGEMVGGLFYGNYPGGSGLTAGAVFGRRAGRSAARLVSGEE